MENLEKLVNDPEAMEIIASKESSVRAFIYNTDAFAALCKNEAALNILVSSETAMNVLVDNMEKVAKIENVFVGFKKNLAEIETNLPLVTDEPIVDGIIETRRDVEKSLEKLNSITDMADTLVINMQSLFGNENYFKVLASNANASTAIANNQACINALYDHRAITYKYITPEWELGKALLKSKLALAISDSYDSATAYIGYNYYPGFRINVGKPKFIGLSISASRGGASSPSLSFKRNYNGTGFTDTETVQNWAGVHYINAFFSVISEAYFARSYIGGSGSHSISILYIPVTN